MKSQYILQILFLSIFISCGEVENKPEQQTENITENLVDTPYVIIPFNPSEYTRFDNTYSATSLSQSEVYKVDSIVNVCIQTNQRNLPPALKKHFEIDFSKYKRQYVTVLNESREKEVWVNCFCINPATDWTKEIVLAKDGGNCYFNVIINLRNMSCRDFAINDAP